VPPAPSVSFSWVYISLRKALLPTATFGSLATTLADTLERCCTPSGNNSGLTLRAPGTSAMKKPVRAWQRPWCGVAASLRSCSRGRKARRGADATWRQRDRRRFAGQRKRARSTRRCAAYRATRRRRFLHRLFARFRQLHGPGPLPPGINFEKPGAVMVNSLSRVHITACRRRDRSRWRRHNNDFATAHPYTPGIGPPVLILALLQPRILYGL
jgi:hypothetical protein